MSLTGFHPLWDKILSQNLQAVADQGCHLEGSSPYKGTDYRGLYSTLHHLFSLTWLEGCETLLLLCSRVWVFFCGLIG
jgi:hypothetical protein